MIKNRIFGIIVGLLFSMNSYGNERNLYIYAPRPIAEAVVVLSEQIGCPITYEDPPFEFSNDLQTVFPGSNTRIPREEQINISYRETANALDIISQLLDTHSANGNAGIFEVFKNNNLYNVLCIRYKDKMGESINHSSILDNPISISVKDVSLQRVLEVVCEKASKIDNRFRLEIGRTPSIAEKMSYSCDNMPARNVINQILLRLNQTQADKIAFWTWQMRFIPPTSEMQNRCYVLVFQKISFREGDSSSRMRVISKRPMASSVKILEKLSGKAIAYEDPPYVCSCDTLGNSESKDLAGGIIDISWGEDDNLDTILDILTEIPIQPRLNPEIFRWNKSENIYYVYPYMSKDEQGNLVTRTSVMDQNVSIDVSNNDELSVLKSICSGLSNSAKEKVMLGLVPESIATPMRNKVSLMASAPNKKKDISLIRFLGETNGNTSWQLLFDPTLKQYELIPHDVKAKSSH